MENKFNRWAGLKLPDGTAQMIPAADITLRVGDTGMQGEKPASQWCEADLFIENTNADRDIYIVYTRDGETWEFKRGLLTTPDAVGAGYEQTLIDAYNYYWPEDGACDDNSVKAIAAFYKPDLLNTTCKDEYDYVLENDALPGLQNFCIKMMITELDTKKWMINFSLKGKNNCKTR